MRNLHETCIAGLQREYFFENYSPSSPGYLLRGGVGVPVRRSDWSDIREMWSYPYYVLEFMLEDGAGTYRNESGFECQLAYGDFVLVLPHCKHYYGPGKDERWSEICVSFVGKVFDLYLDANGLLAPSPVWRLSDPTPWLERLRKFLTAERPSTEIAGSLETVHFLSFLLEMMEQATPVVGSQSPGDWFTQACLLLTQDLHHKVDLHSIAGKLGMSYHTFRLYFKRRAGISPIQYRDHQRVQVASDLLQTTAKSCRSIAFTLGYSNGEHFSSHFKTHTGLSPREYRKRAAQTNLLQTPSGATTTS